MTVNPLKTAELVFRRPNISNDLIPSVMSDVRRVGAAKLLGVHLTQNFSFSQHIDAVVTVCNKRLYLLAQLKRQGLIKVRWTLFLTPLLPIISYMHYLFAMDI